MPVPKPPVEGFEVCVKCGVSRIPSSETEEHGRWVCDGPSCQPMHYTMDLVDWISTRIAVTSSEDDDMSRFVFRELVQNADDVESSILVARFLPDALEVANDGFAFRSPSGDRKGDFQRIALVLQRHQEDDPTTTGKFGTGFQTVYNLTNRPEIHSDGISRRMDPAAESEDRMQKLEGFEKRKSPYLPKGVLFRFPWRDDREAETARGVDKRPFQDQDKWPRWNAQGRRDLYNDLVGYLHDVLLCCRHLRCIRLIWESEGEATAYQAERDFDLPAIKDGDISVHARTREVREGPGTGGFEYASWKWDGKPKSTQYLVASKNVDRNGRQVYMMKGTRKGKRVKLVTRYPEKADEKILESDVHVLLPLSPNRLRGDGGRTRFVYSVIPLPKRGGTFFAVSACWVPLESRNDINVSGRGGPWYETLLESAVRLYRDVFPKFADEIRKSKQSDADKQEALLDALPPPSILQWLNKDITDPEFLLPVKLQETLVESILNEKILWVNGGWEAPADAYWVDDLSGQQALESMRVPFLTRAFLEHSRFGTLKEAMEDRRLRDSDFARMWTDFETKRAGRDGFLRYGTGQSKNTIGHDFVAALVQFCLVRSSETSVQQLNVVPDAEGRLRSIDSFVSVPKEHPALEALLPKSSRIHPDFAQVLKSKVAGHLTVPQLFAGLTDSTKDAKVNPSLVRALYDFLELCEDDPYRMKIPLADEIEELGFLLIPDDNGDMLRPRDATYAPLDLFDRAVDLFRLAGAKDLRWASRQYVERYSALLLNLGIARADYRRLLGRIDWAKTPRQPLDFLVLAEGLVNTRPPAELKDVAFVSCDGVLRPPSRVVLGSTGDSDIDALIGVIDPALRKSLEKLGLLDLLKSAGAVDLNPLQVAKMISTLAEREPDRFANVNDKDLLAVSKAIGYLCRQSGFALSADLLDLRFIPARYDGKLTLVAPPGWHDTAMRPENYHRDWVFSPSEGSLSGLTKEVEAKVRLLDLHPGARVDLKKVKSTFHMQALKERGLLNFMQRFVADLPDIGQLSLFRDEALAAFLGRGEKRFLEAQKKELLKAVREYFFKRGEETENPGLKKDQLCVVPMLYTPDLNWIAPELTVLHADDGLKALGVEKLHPDFDKWEEPVLEAIGVPRSVLPEPIAREVTRLAKGRKRGDLADILLYVLTSDVPLEGDLLRLVDEAWIPTRDRSLHTPPETVFPSKDNEAALNSADVPFGAFLDYAAASVGSQKESEKRARNLGQAGDVIRGRAAKLGIVVSPPTNLLLQVLRTHAAKNKTPPPQLFDLMSKTIAAGEPTEKDQLDWSGLKYWANGKWWAPTAVVISDSVAIPDSLREEYLRIGSGHAHEKLLLAMGALKTPSISHLLRWLSRSEGAESGELWRQVVASRGQIDADVQFEFKGVSVFPVAPGELQAPENLVVSPHEYRGFCGGFYVIPETGVSSADRDALLRLGAQTLGTLAQPGLLEITRSIPSDEEGLLQDKDADFLYQVVCEFARRSLDGRHAFLPCVTQKMGRQRFQKVLISKAYLPDHQAWSLYETSIPFFIAAETKGGTEASKVFDWARRNGVKSLKDSVKPRVQFDEKLAKPDSSQEVRFHEMGGYLEMFLSSWLRSRKITSARPSVDWLAKVEVKRVPTLRESYILPDVPAQSRPLSIFTSPAHGRPETLYIPQIGPYRFYQEMARIVLEICFGGPGALVANPQLAELTAELEFLLSEPPETWPSRLAGYRLNSSVLVEDLLVVVEEADEEGYYETRAKLSAWYPGCQICRRRTPWSEGGQDSMENVKSVISHKGGRYRGERRISVRNSLWLCPLHQTLYERKLVKIPLLEDGSLPGAQELLKRVTRSMERLGKGDSPYEKLPDFCSVVTWQYSADDFTKYDPIEEKSVVFHYEHLKQMLQQFCEYLEERNQQ